MLKCLKNAHLRGSSFVESFQIASKKAARQCEHLETRISVCNGLIDLKLQEVCSNKHINWLRHQVG